MSSQLEDSPTCMETIELSTSLVNPSQSEELSTSLVNPSQSEELSTSQSENSEDSSNIVQVKPPPKPLPAIPTQISYPPYDPPVISGVKINKSEILIADHKKVKINKSKAGDHMSDADFKTYLSKINNNKSRKFSKKQVRRFKVSFIYIEVISIILICSLYAAWSFKWNNHNVDIGNAYKNNSIVMILGIFAWIVFYLGFVIINITVRCLHRKRTRSHVFIYSAASIIHISYYLIRWPIFIGMISSNDDETTQIALFLDPIVDLSLFIICGVIYLTNKYCE